jgi:hypothetical protein
MGSHPAGNPARDIYLKFLNNPAAAGVTHPNPITPMKTLPRFFLLLLLGSLLGQAIANDQPEREPLTPEQIEELVSPIALYPDPLIALILPASTFPSDIVLAARFLDSGGAVAGVTNEPWDDSVRALARYREVIDYLDTHLAWTRSLGHCFLDQPDAVMDAIQLVRVRARTAGLLQDSVEQHVIVEPEEIRIVPAQPTVIYVPRYDPTIIYRSRTAYYDYGRPFITFGIGWGIGSWLNFDCDWRGRSVRVVNRPAHWYHSPRWDDRDRFRHYSGSSWTRRTIHPRHDNRFDRSPRSAGYQPRGADHRNWSDRNRGGSDDRDRHDIRRDYHRPDHPRQSSSPSVVHDQRSRDWENRRRREMEFLQGGNPVVTPTTAPAVVATSPQVRAHQSLRRPPSGGHSVDGRSHHSSGHNRDRHDSSDRRVSPRQERPAAPQVTQRSEPTVQPRPQSQPARRVEAQDRSDERRRSGASNEQDQRSAVRAGGSRGVDRQNLQR